MINHLRTIAVIVLVIAIFFSNKFYQGKKIITERPVEVVKRTLNASCWHNGSPWKTMVKLSANGSGSVSWPGINSGLNPKDFKDPVDFTWIATQEGFEVSSTCGGRLSADGKNIIIYGFPGQYNEVRCEIVPPPKIRF